MRMSQEEKGRSHARIVESAARLLRRDGLDGASVTEVMREAGMTHGGFYKHFETKEAMAAAALEQAFEETLARMQPGQQQGSAGTLAERFQDFYLSDFHCAATAKGCPIAALSNDISRGSSELKTQFGAGVRRIVKALAASFPGSELRRERRAMRQLAMMAGAVMIARASDPETGQLVLAACRGTVV